MDNDLREAIARIDERTKNITTDVADVLTFVKSNGVRIGKVEVEQGKQGEQIKTHSKFIWGAFSASAFSGFIANFFWAK